MRIFVFQSAATADEQISDMNIENYIEQAAARAVERLYPQAAGAPIQIQRTRREFEGDYTLVVFPLLKASRKGTRSHGSGDWRGTRCRRQRYRIVQRSQRLPEHDAAPQLLE